MKKILAIAIASAFAAPAFAATANVDIYGEAHMSVDWLDNDTDGGVNVSSNASNIGFKGSEDLGGGLKAIWQYETTVGMDGPESNSDSFVGAMRDTFVGLSGGWGTARLGYFDTPLKKISRKTDLFNNRIGDTRNLFGGASSGWDARFRNGIAYDSPSFGGVTLSAHYSSQYKAQNAGGTQNTVATAIVSGPLDDDAWSVGANFKLGPVDLMAAYQKAEVSGTTAGDEKAWRLGALMNFGMVGVNALYHQAKDQGGVNGADRKVYGLGAQVKLGNGALKGQYYKATDLKGNATADQSADLWAVGYDYSLSKRTTVYAAYSQASNDANGTFSMAGGGHGDNFGTTAPNNITAGSDVSGFSLGVQHKF